MATSRDKTLFKVDPATASVIGGVRIGATVGGVAFGGDGMWVVGSDGSLPRIDPVSERVVKARLEAVVARAAPWARFQRIGCQAMSEGLLDSVRPSVPSLFMTRTPPAESALIAIDFPFGDQIGGNHEPTQQPE